MFPSKYGSFRVVVAIAVGACGHAFAAHPLVADDAETLGQGKFELELGVEYAPSGSAESFEGGMQLSWGVLPDVDLSLRPVWLNERASAETGTPSEHGWGDTTLSVKWRVLRGEIWSLALQAGAQLPTGDSSKGLGKGFVAWQGSAIATADIEALHLDCNIGYEQDIDDELVVRHLLNGQFALRWSASETWQLVSEIGIERNLNQADRTWPAAARLGAIFTVTPWLDLDIGYQGRLNHAAPRQVILAGATIRW